jgi:mycothiol system anti-sigma-R factor
MNCRRIREVIFLFTDNEAGEEIQIEVREHLHICPACAQQLDYTRKLLALLKSGCSGAAAPDRLRRRILTSLPHRRPGGEETRE